MSILVISFMIRLRIKLENDLARPVFDSYNEIRPLKGDTVF